MLAAASSRSARDDATDGAELHGSARPAGNVRALALTTLVTPDRSQSTSARETSRSRAGSSPGLKHPLGPQQCLNKPSPSVGSSLAKREPGRCCGLLPCGATPAGPPSTAGVAPCHVVEVPRSLFRVTATIRGAPPAIPPPSLVHQWTREPIEERRSPMVSAFPG
jgi:hypothetical protein